MQKHNAIELLLRIGVAFAFVYPAIAAYFDPFSWIGFFPILIRDLFPSDEILLHLFGLSEIVIAVWILIGKRIFIPSVLAALYLLAIVVLNISLLDVIFRDIPILLMAVALAIMHHEKKTIEPLQQ
jgi:hypothetical protein